MTRAQDLAFLTQRAQNRRSPAKETLPLRCLIAVWLKRVHDLRKHAGNWASDGERNERMGEKWDLCHGERIEETSTVSDPDVP